MHIITRKRLNEFAEKYPETKTALVHWYELVKQNDFGSFSELRLIFPGADQINKLTVFNIGGNKVRLVAAIHYNRKNIYIRSVLTHSDYDESKWRK
ncbi:MAG: type II toxin-antitoxin system HigB family toxin [Synechococcaceae cyanobacterium SM1_2_3]|nr:type II toxin-antitoxin system HigB family toxin [Synechococcaceae cyanobacterium SM1_2_3]